VAVATGLQQLSEQFQVLPSHKRIIGTELVAAAQPAADSADSADCGGRDAASGKSRSSSSGSSGSGSTATADGSLNNKARGDKTHEYLLKIRMVAAATLPKQQQCTKRKASAIAPAPAPTHTQRQLTIG
jgi:hypothetical protein